MDESKCIMGMIASPEFPSGKFNRDQRMLVCNRIDTVPYNSAERYSGGMFGNIDWLEFRSNQTILLKKIHYGEFLSYNEFCPNKLRELTVYVEAYRGWQVLIYRGHIKINGHVETIVELPTPIFIRENLIYWIQLEVGPNFGAQNYLVHKPEVHMNHGVTITFEGSKDMK